MHRLRYVLTRVQPDSPMVQTCAHSHKASAQTPSDVKNDILWKLAQFGWHCTYVRPRCVPSTPHGVSSSMPAQSSPDVSHATGPMYLHAPPGNTHLVMTGPSQMLSWLYRDVYGWWLKKTASTPTLLGASCSALHTHAVTTHYASE
jgi:hypothetical protein